MGGNARGYENGGLKPTLRCWIPTFAGTTAEKFLFSQQMPTLMGMKAAALNSKQII